MNHFSLGGKIRHVVMDQNFWTGYRKNVIKEDEVLSAIFIPFSVEVIYIDDNNHNINEIAWLNVSINIIFLNLESILQSI